MTSSRSPSLPPARATALFARTVFRQLRAAGYGATEVVAFINELLGLVAQGLDDAPMSGVSDPETSLPNSEALRDVLEFELRRTSSTPGAPLLLIVLDIVAPEWCADAVLFALHERVAAQLRRGLRPTDTAARLASQRYALVLPATPLVRAPMIAGRIIEPILRPRRQADAPPLGTVATFRVVAAHAEDTATSIVSRCLAVEPRPIDFEARRSPSALPPPNEEPSGQRERVSAGLREVVLALGGGAARAAAHIGVLGALRDAKIEVAAVAGTSAGAIVGAMALLGMSDSDILGRFVAFTQSPIYKLMRRRYVEYRRSSKVPRATVAYFRQSGIAFLSAEQLAAFDDELFERFIEFFVGPDRDIRTLPKPLGIAATDLVTGRNVHIFHGPLHLALRASCALPGLFRPQVDGERLFIDGSTVAEVPVQAAVQLGVAAPILAVHLARPEQSVDAFASSLEVVMRSGTLVHRELVREQLRQADHLVTAPVDDIGWLEFRRAHDTARIGAEAAREYLDLLARSR